VFVLLVRLPPLLSSLSGLLIDQVQSWFVIILELLEFAICELGTMTIGGYAAWDERSNLDIIGPRVSLAYDVARFIIYAYMMECKHLEDNGLFVSQAASFTAVPHARKKIHHMRQPNTPDL
jgi:hypothetical protein